MTATLPRVPGSPSDELLLDHLRGHIDEEQEILDAYAAVGDRAPEHVRYLINLIVDDEERHHRMLQEMANRLDEDISYESAGPAVPHVVFGTTDRDQLMADT